MPSITPLRKSSFRQENFLRIEQKRAFQKFHKWKLELSDDDMQFLFK